MKLKKSNIQKDCFFNQVFSKGVVTGLDRIHPNFHAIVMFFCVIF